MNSNKNSLVCLYSEPNFLAVSVLENLLANGCYVNIFTSDVRNWGERTEHIVTKNKFNIGMEKTFNTSIDYGYIIFSSGFLVKENASIELKSFLEKAFLSKTKSILILPKETYGVINPNSLKIGDNTGVVYIGDLLGPRIDLESDLKMPTYLKQIINTRSLSMPIGENLYPVFAGDVARQIVRWLFAFGPYGKETFLLGPDTSTSVFWQANEKFLGTLKYTTTTNGVVDRLPRNVEFVRFGKDLNYCLSETYRWISLKLDKYRNAKAPTVKTLKKSALNVKPFKTRVILGVSIVVLLLPIITVLFGGGLMYVAYHAFQSGHDTAAINFLYTGKIISSVGYYESTVLKYIPLVGQIYKETDDISLTLVSVSKIGLNTIPVIRKGGELMGNVLGNSLYSIEETQAGTRQNLQQVYKDLSFLQEKNIQNKTKGSLVAGYFLSQVNLEYYKNLVSQMIVINGKLPEVLGKDGSKTYLVLFENNMELRPTGGYIGSYGLLTFDGGRLSDFTISDIYSADGQLNGHVEPPTPIREYLGEANWWFRDSNWDPDFPTSAKRAEWFLDKETEKQVDGVISIDLNPVKSFVGISGPVSLPDYNLSITEGNLYEKVQSEVQDNFFPGTYKKASFLTALSRSILGKMGDLSSFQKVALLKLVYENLDQKHIQVFLHDSDFQKSIASLNWDGSVFIPACSEPCFSDLAGIVEANVGVNKSNYFVTRDTSIAIKLGDGVVERTLTLTLKNSANTNLGPSGNYKSYVRLLIPEGSTDIKVGSVFGQDLQTLMPDSTTSKGHMEVGVIIDVLAGETKQISFSWSGTYNYPTSEYNFFLRKQAGVDGYPVSIRVVTPIKALGSNPAFSLTDKGDYLYNTTLVRDLMTRLSF